MRVVQTERVGRGDHLALEDGHGRGDAHAMLSVDGAERVGHAVVGHQTRPLVHAAQRKKNRINWTVFLFVYCFFLYSDRSIRVSCRPSRAASEDLLDFLCTPPERGFRCYNLKDVGGFPPRRVALDASAALIDRAMVTRPSDPHQRPRSLI